MAFGNISIDPAAFAPQNGQNGLLSGLMMGAQMRAYQEDREQKRLDQEKEQALAGAMQGVDPNDPATFKTLYPLNPLLAMKLETEAVERRKALSQEEAANQEKLREAYTDWAKGFSNYWSQLPPEQRNPQTAHAMLGAAVNHYQTMNPQLARVLATAPKENPQWLEHALQNGGFTDPYAQDQREIAKQAQLNQLPPNPYQQAQLEQQGQQNDWNRQKDLMTLDNQRLTQSNANFERISGRRKEFNALPEVVKLNSLLPMAQAVREASKLDTKAANLDMIYGTAKTVDPEGVVRGEDNKMIVATGSPAEQFIGLWNYVTGGGQLTEEMRKNLVGVIDNREKQARAAYDARRKSYEGILQKESIDPSMVFSEPMSTSFSPAQQPAPQSGMGAPAMGGGLREGRTGIDPKTGRRVIVRNGQVVPM